MTRKMRGKRATALLDEVMRNNAALGGGVAAAGGDLSYVLQASRPLKAKFNFRARTGRINWRLLHSLDLEQAVRDGDVDSIMAYSENIMYSKFGEEDLQLVSDGDLVKFVSLLQLCMEFLSVICESAPQLIDSLVEKVRAQHVLLLKSRPSKRSSQEAAQPARRHRSHEKRAPIVTHKCAYCVKQFKTEQYLHEHIHKRHPEALMQEKPFVASPPEDEKKQPEPLQEVQPEPSPSTKTSVVEQPAPMTVPVLALDPQLQLEMEGLYDQLRVMQSDFSDSLCAVRKDIARMEKVLPPADVAPPDTRSTTQADASQHSDLESHMVKIVEQKMEALAKKVEKAVDPKFAVGGSSSRPGGDVDTSALASMLTHRVEEAVGEQVRAMQQQQQEQMGMLQQIHKLQSAPSTPSQAKASPPSAAPAASVMPAPALAAAPAPMAAPPPAASSNAAAFAATAAKAVPDAPSGGAPASSPKPAPPPTVTQPTPAPSMPKSEVPTKSATPSPPATAATPAAVTASPTAVPNAQAAPSAGAQEPRAGPAGQTPVAATPPIAASAPASAAKLSERPPAPEVIAVPEGTTEAQTGDGDQAATGSGPPGAGVALEDPAPGQAEETPAELPETPAAQKSGFFRCFNVSGISKAATPKKGSEAKPEGKAHEGQATENQPAAPASGDDEKVLAVAAGARAEAKADEDDQDSEEAAAATAGVASPPLAGVHLGDSEAGQAKEKPTELPDSPAAQKTGFFGCFNVPGKQRLATPRPGPESKTEGKAQEEICAEAQPAPSVSGVDQKGKGQDGESVETPLPVPAAGTDEKAAAAHVGAAPLAGAGVQFEDSESSDDFDQVEEKPAVPPEDFECKHRQQELPDSPAAQKTGFFGCFSVPGKLRATTSKNGSESKTEGKAKAQEEKTSEADEKADGANAQTAPAAQEATPCSVTSAVEPQGEPIPAEPEIAEPTSAEPRALEPPSSESLETEPSAKPKAEANKSALVRTMLSSGMGLLRQRRPAQPPEPKVQEPAQPDVETLQPSISPETSVAASEASVAAWIGAGGNITRSVAAASPAQVVLPKAVAKELSTSNVPGNAARPPVASVAPPLETTARPMLVGAKPAAPPAPPARPSTSGFAEETQISSLAAADSMASPAPSSSPAAALAHVQHSAMSSFTNEDSQLRCGIGGGGCGWTGGALPGPSNMAVSDAVQAVSTQGSSASSSDVTKVRKMSGTMEVKSMEHSDSAMSASSM